MTMLWPSSKTMWIVATSNLKMNDADGSHYTFEPDGEAVV